MGTSGVIVLYPAPSEDHPHACGDKAREIALFQYLSGSSPRVWGQVILLLPSCPYVRIIPTRVGTRRTQGDGQFRLQDHPHACGDKRYALIITYLIPGSSPRVWGQVRKHRQKTSQTGIIPTRVGTSI